MKFMKSYMQKHYQFKSWHQFKYMSKAKAYFYKHNQLNMESNKRSIVLFDFMNLLSLMVAKNEKGNMVPLGVIK